MTFIHTRVEMARRGDLDSVIRRMPSGWAVSGDHQLLRGYSLLDRAARVRFLFDMSLLGEAFLAVTPAYRMNYEILGNLAPALHAHVTPLLADEPEAYRHGPPGRYPRAQQEPQPFSFADHAALGDQIGAALDALLRAENGGRV